MFIVLFEENLFSVFMNVFINGIDSIKIDYIIIPHIPQIPPAIGSSSSSSTRVSSKESSDNHQTHQIIHVEGHSATAGGKEATAFSQVIQQSQSPDDDAADVQQDIHILLVLIDALNNADHFISQRLRGIYRQQKREGEEGECVVL